MTLTTLLLQLLLTIPLTFILNNINKNSNNTLNKIVFPIIYTIIVAAVIPIVKENIFLIVVFELLLRNFYINNFTNKSKNIAMFLIESLLSVVLSLFVYNNFISRVDTVLPSAETIKPFLWFLIILYIFNLSKSEIHKVNNFIPKNQEIDKENIIMQYAKYKNKYHKIIKTKSKLITNLIYSIMIYNGTNKPLAYRKTIELKGILTTKEVPYGIMQYTSKEKLTDEESIIKTIKDFETLLTNIKGNEEIKLEKLLNKYSLEDSIQIKKINNEIIEFLKK